MGYNTTVIVLNDALDNIANDPNFGKKLVAAIKNACYGTTNVSAGGFVNAATVIESHHADEHVLVDIGGNMGKVVPPPVKHCKAWRDRVAWAQERHNRMVNSKD
jgi:uncharacterized hydantoinase/oxoprolinase family protein